MDDSIPTLANGLKVAVIGADSKSIASDLGLSNNELENADAAIFQVSARTNISEDDVRKWHQARELYIPSLILKIGRAHV